MSEVIIYHNPRCSKSRQTLQLLHQKGIEPKVIEYLNHPPSAKQLKEILALLELSPRDLMRKKEASYKELKLADTQLTDAQLVKAMIEHPILIERPIVLANNKAAIGRPPENILAIL